MTRPVFFAGFVSLLMGGCATHPELPWESDQLRQLTSPSLQKFENREALDDYFRRFSEVAEANDVWWARTLTLDSSQFLAQLDPVQPEPQCDPEFEDCGEDSIVVTGSRVSATSSITNNQAVTNED